MKWWKGVIVNKLQPCTWLENHSQEVQWKWWKFPWNSPVLLSGDSTVYLACYITKLCMESFIDFKMLWINRFKWFFPLFVTYHGTSLCLNLKVPISRYFYDLIPNIGTLLHRKLVNGRRIYPFNKGLQIYWGVHHPPFDTLKIGTSTNVIKLKLYT